MSFWTALSALAPIAPAAAEADEIKRNRAMQDVAFRAQQAQSQADLQEKQQKIRAGNQPIFLTGSKPEWNPSTHTYTQPALDPTTGAIKQVDFPGADPNELAKRRFQESRDAYKAVTGKDPTPEMENAFAAAAFNVKPPAAASYTSQEKTDTLVASLGAKGQTVDRNEDGSLKRNPDGSLAIRNLTPDELKDNPVLAMASQYKKAQIDQLTEKAKQIPLMTRIAQLREQRLRETAQTVRQPGAVDAWVRAVTDPLSGVTIANVPAAARGAVLTAVNAAGKRVAKPLTGDEIKRMDLASNAIKNVEAAQAILARRPDMFGPAGWGSTKFQQALAGGDPDAMDYLADIRLANLPAVGIHGVRGKWALEDLDKLDGNLYLNAKSMTRVLDDIHRSASEFENMGGRRGVSAPTSSPSSSSTFDPSKLPDAN